MDVFDNVVEILGTTLQLDGRVSELQPSSPLLGSVPEFDSMAVVNVITGLEEAFGFEIDDDEISAEIFESVGSLCHFVEQKLEGAGTSAH